MTAECGTYSGWNRHIRLEEPICDACREAQRNYQRQWRRNNPDKQKIQERYLLAADRARRDLAKKYPDEYRQLYQSYKQQMMEGK